MNVYCLMQPRTHPPAQGWIEGCGTRSVPAADWTMGQVSMEKPAFPREGGCGDEAKIVGQFAISSGISRGRV